MSGSNSSGHAPRTTSQRVAWMTTVVTASLVLVFLMAPILAIMPLSFSSGSYLTYPLPGFSFRWSRISSARRAG